MANKLKRWHKISLISIAVIIAILISFNVWLNFFLKKSLEQGLAEMYNAEIEIGKLRVNFLAGSMNVYDISFLGKGQFATDTLIFLDELILVPDRFDQKTNEMVFKELRIVNLKVNSIIGENGSNCWDNFLIENNEIVNDSSENMSLFFNSIIFENAEFQIIDKAKKTNQIYSDIYVSINSVVDQEKILSEFNAECSAKTDYFESEQILLIGNSSYDDKQISASAELRYNGFPVDINLSLFTDSLSNELSSLSVEADLSKHKVSENISGSGKVSLKATSQGLLNELTDFNFHANFVADSVSIFNSATKSALNANFNLGINYEYADKKNIRIKTNDFFLLAGKDTISGNLDFYLNDTVMSVTSDFSGNVNSQTINKIFGDKTLPAEIKLSVLSNLNGRVNKIDNELNGEFLSVLKIKNPEFKMPELTILFNSEMLSVNALVDSDPVTGSLLYEMTDIANLFAEGTVKQNIAINIRSLKIPSEGAKNQDLLMKFDGEQTGFVFPKKTGTTFIFNIDSLIFDNKILTNFRTTILYNPESFEIPDFSVNIGDGSLKGQLYYNINEKNTILNSSLLLQNLDLSFFADSTIDIKGIINCDFSNTIYSGSGTTSYLKNNGKNVLSIEDFKLKTGLFQEYELDVEYLTIGNTELVANLVGDKFSLEPANIIVNDAELNVKGDYNILTDSILVSALIDMPDKYMSSKIKLLISMFAVSSENKLPKKSNRKIYLIKMEGLITDPDYKIYQ